MATASAAVFTESGTLSVEQSLADLIDELKNIRAEEAKTNTSSAGGISVQENQTNDEESQLASESRCPEADTSNTGHKCKISVAGLVSALSTFAKYFLDLSARALLNMAMAYILIFVVLPLIIGIILYYVEDSPTDAQDKASSSYISLFVARQSVGLAVATVLESLTMIIFRALGKLPFLGPKSNTPSPPTTQQVAGSVVNLLVIQSNGWPLILFWWSVFDMIFLSGSRALSHHWLYFQDSLPVFNDSNPSGNLVENAMYFKVLSSALFVSIAVAIKRFFVRLYLDKQAYQFYGQKLVLVMRKIVIVVELSKAQSAENRTNDESAQFNKLLKQKEGPTLPSQTYEDASIRAVLLFRMAKALVQERYPLKRAGAVYKVLCDKQDTGDDDGSLNLKTMAFVAVKKNKPPNERKTREVMKRKTRELVKLFRPCPDGKVPKEDFIRIINEVYKEYRLLKLTAGNTSQLDEGFEQVVNLVFYVAVALVIPFLLGYSPMALYVSLSSVIVSFAFIFGKASESFFQGFLFIIVRRPYDIGDWVEVDPSETSSTLTKENAWRVESVTLFYTAVASCANDARANWSNGTLADSRIINWTRSPATIQIVLQVDKSDDQSRNSRNELIIENFKNAIKTYATNNPREWRAVNLPNDKPIDTGDFIEQSIEIQ